MKQFFKLLLFYSIPAVLITFLIGSQVTNFPAYADTEGAGSSIGGVDVSGLDEEEVKAKLLEAIAGWQQQPTSVEGGGYQIEFDKSLIEFQVDSTVQSFKNLTDKPWYEFWGGDKKVQLPLEAIATDGLRAEIEAVAVWETEETMANILADASYLKNSPVQAQVSNYSALEQERLAFEIQSIPAGAEGVNVLAEQLNESIIAPDELFSLYSASDIALNQANTEAASFVASVVYAVALKSNTQVYERHSQNKRPSYLEPGVEASVNLSGSKDLKFINKTSAPILIRSVVEGNNFKIEFYSSTNSDLVEMRVVQADEVKPKTTTRYSADLGVGAVRVLEPGEKGVRTYVYRTINGEEQSPIRDYYAPKNRVVLKSSRQPEPQQGETGQADPNNPNGAGSNGQSGTGQGSNGQANPSNPNNPSGSDGNSGSSSDDEEKDPVYDKSGNLISEKEVLNDELFIKNKS